MEVSGTRGCPRSGLYKELALVLRWSPPRSPRTPPAPPHRTAAPGRTRRSAARGDTLRRAGGAAAARVPPAADTHRSASFPAGAGQRRGDRGTAARRRPRLCDPGAAPARGGAYPLIGCRLRRGRGRCSQEGCRRPFVCGRAGRRLPQPPRVSPAASKVAALREGLCESRWGGACF